MLESLIIGGSGSGIGEGEGEGEGDGEGDGEVVVGAGETVTLQLALASPYVTVIVALPARTGVTFPLLSTLAIEELELLHLTAVPGESEEVTVAISLDDPRPTVSVMDDLFKVTPVTAVSLMTVSTKSTYDVSTTRVLVMSISLSLSYSLNDSNGDKSET